MELRLAHKLLSVLLPDVTDVLSEFIDYRIELLRTQLERTKDDRQVHELQGSISELRNLRSIREMARDVDVMHKQRRE